MLNTQEVLKEGEKRRVRSPEAWFIQTCSAQKLHMSFSEGQHNESCLIQEGALLFIEQAVVAPVSGDLVFRLLKIEVLSKLLAFIDGAGLMDTTYAEPDKWVLLSPEFRAIWQDRKRCEYWFLQQIITPSPAFNKVLALLRKSESYWLVGYLLAQSTSGNTMRMLGEDYGVSYTHFRRLCSRALGGKAKSELRNWRMAQSLLNSVEGHENITQLAVNNGYSSPSHFSNEIKELIGVSPRKLSNIIQLADK